MDNLIIGKNIYEIINLIKTQGICIIKNYVQPDTLSKIEKDFDHILKEFKCKLDKNTGVNRCLRTNLNSKEVKNTTINEIYSTDFVNNIAKGVLGSFKSDNIFIHKDFKNIGTNNTYPHFDYDRKLKFYICVNNMDKTNGCFKALPGKIDLVKEKRNINRRKNIFTPGHKLYNGTEIKLNELIPIECDAGDLIIFDTNCIHAGGDNFEKGKFRKVIRLHLSKKISFNK